MSSRSPCLLPGCLSLLCPGAETVPKSLNAQLRSTCMCSWHLLACPQASGPPRPCGKGLPPPTRNFLFPAVTRTALLMQRLERFLQAVSKRTSNTFQFVPKHKIKHLRICSYEDAEQVLQHCPYLLIF